MAMRGTFYSDNQSPNPAQDRKRISLLVSWGGVTTFICSRPHELLWSAALTPRGALRILGRAISTGLNWKLGAILNVIEPHDPSPNCALSCRPLGDQS
jgi:hypothetical protein